MSNLTNNSFEETLTSTLSSVNIDGHSNGLDCMLGIGFTSLEHLLSMFYIMSPSKTTYDDPYQVPNYELTLIPAIGLFLIIEQVIRFFQRKDLSRFEDVVVNIGSALIFTLARIFLLSVVIVIFVWLHTNYKIVDLPLHSVWTWLLSLLLVEFVYYWTHRALHEFNILWAAHQFHHMAEDVNISTTVRDSIVDLVIYDIFPLPLAVIIPPPILVVHIQFSLIYQIWLHNEVIGNLGFIEYIINTPRQHRVHHGKNPYCIDKNYGALIMVWDRIFGTHQVEQEDEKIVYGVVSPTPATFDPMTLQFGYYRDLWHKFKTVEGFGNKLSALFKGPGWAPGKPRLGLISDVPKPDPSAPKYSYEPVIEFWRKVYVFIHSSFLMLGFFLIADHPLIRFSPLNGLIGMFYIILTLTAFGTIFDNRRYAILLEVVRCLLYFPFDYYLIASVHWNLGPSELLLANGILWTVRTVHAASIVIWLAMMLKSCCLPGDDNNNQKQAQYMISPVSDTEKDIDPSAIMSRTTKFQVFSILMLLSVMFTAFFIAWAIRIEECSKFANQFKFA